jgi:hypothetical protein
MATDNQLAFQRPGSTPRKKTGPSTPEARAKCAEAARLAGIRRRDEYRPTISADELRAAHFQEGLSKKAMIAKFGVTVGALDRMLSHYGIKLDLKISYTRKERCYTATHLNSMTAHKRVMRARGSASTHGCSQCWRADSGVRYEWANLTGNYADVEDYAPMCSKCHGAYDSMRRRLTGVNTSDLEPMKPKAVPCAVCGRAISHVVGVCTSCYAKARRPAPRCPKNANRHPLILEMLKDGCTAPEISLATGCNSSSIQHRRNQLRSKGWLPYYLPGEIAMRLRKPMQEAA